MNFGKFSALKEYLYCFVGRVKATESFIDMIRDSFFEKIIYRSEKFDLIVQTIVLIE